MRRIEDFFEIKNKADLLEFSIGGDVIYIKEVREQIKVKLHEIILNSDLAIPIGRSFCDNMNVLQ